MMSSSGRRRVDSSAVEEVLGNEDLLTELLLRLPVKSLLRFKSVSKKWLSIISLPDFARNYTCLRKPSGLFMNNKYAGLQFVPFNNDGDETRVSLSNPQIPEYITISQSCNGIVLMSSSGINGCLIYYMYNPATKQFTTIPYPTLESRNSVVSLHLAFDPYKSPHFYKLICVQIVKTYKPLTYRICIYSSETRSWRNPISTSPDSLIFSAPDAIDFYYSVFCNGAVHWFSYGETSLYFNTDSECLNSLPMPSFHEAFIRQNIRYLGESRGHLHLVLVDELSALEFDILELKTDYSGWFVKYHVNLAAVTVTFPDLIWNCDGYHYAFSLLFVDGGEKEHGSTELVLFVYGEAISFNLNNKTSKKLCDLVPCQRFCSFELNYEWFDAFQYTETLFRV